MKLIVFSGLPATGKSRIADAMGRATGIPVFNKDWLESTLVQAGFGDPNEKWEMIGLAGYQLLTTLATRQLQLEQSAILDSVLGLERTRREWRNLAAVYGADWVVFECICSDETLHRARLAARQYAIPSRRAVSWAHIERVKSYFKPWQDKRLVLDSKQPLTDNVQGALAYLANTVR
jgi:predicted kinase